MISSAVSPIACLSTSSFSVKVFTLCMFTLSSPLFLSLFATSFSCWSRSPMLYFHFCILEKMLWISSSGSCSRLLHSKSCFRYSITDLASRRCYSWTRSRMLWFIRSWTSGISSSDSLSLGGSSSSVSSGFSLKAPPPNEPTI